MPKEELNFFEKVYDVVREIPFGRVCSYGLIARYLGSPQSARMVGWAMNASHIKEDVPAHRVVNRIGLLTGKQHFEGSNLMQQLLESEGIQIKENQVVDFEQFVWNPADHLSTNT
ncbi:MAG: MGMT family protein [Flavobacteriales bacterium]|nr:MGMT family protein [Flavobacteriaceae bacterium]MDO7592101.1 MGMT family protein [Flavobacteriaceae bacterium]MDO7600000.1 MGMT family protein [Flavobacteriaceae bacterium]MDO7602639.1 MGMT family protein [Flavobacteriaceae bacterium]MDO7615841.1 MGMT family protein [Flavobacteriaceae bacterium]